MWNNTHKSGFCLFCRSSRGVDLVVSSRSRPCRHFTGLYTHPQNNKQQRVEGRKQTNVDLELQTQESEVGTWTFYVFMFLWLSRQLSENLTQPPKMLTHLVICPNFSTPCFGVLLPTDRPGVPLLTDCFRVPFLTDRRPLVLLFRSRRLSLAQLIVWSSCQYRHRKVF